MSNKKVRNARGDQTDGIKFRSLLEGRIYTYLKSKKYTFSYEPEKIVLQEAIKPDVPFYKKKGKDVVQDKSILRAITYTPDFILKIGNKMAYIEAKGFKTDTYNIKVKLFRKWLQGKKNTVFFEVTSVKDLENAIHKYFN